MRIPIERTSCICTYGDVLLNKIVPKYMMTCEIYSNCASEDDDVYSSRERARMRTFTLTMHRSQVLSLRLQHLALDYHTRVHLHI